MANQIEELAGTLEDQANDIAVETARRMIRFLVNDTPVDTTEALSNWQVRLNAPVTNSIAAYFPGERGSTRARSARETIEQSERVLLTKMPGEDIYITNLAPHIEFLNEGSSPQSDGNFGINATMLGSRFVRDQS